MRTHRLNAALTPLHWDAGLRVGIGLALGWLWAWTIDPVLAVTLLNPGTDITPEAASGIAASALTILSWIVPLGGLAMWIGAGASFARNRQAGIQVGPSALAIGGTILVASPAIVTGLQTSVGGTASPGMSWEFFTFMPNPVFVASFVAAKTINRLIARR